MGIRPMTPPLHAETETSALGMLPPILVHLPPGRFIAGATLSCPHQECCGERRLPGHASRAAPATRPIAGAEEDSPGEFSALQDKVTQCSKATDLWAGLLSTKPRAPAAAVNIYKQEARRPLAGDWHARHAQWAAAISVPLASSHFPADSRLSRRLLSESRGAEIPPAVLRGSPRAWPPQILPSLGKSGVQESVSLARAGTAINSWAPVSEACRLCIPGTRLGTRCPSPCASKPKHSWPQGGLVAWEICRWSC